MSRKKIILASQSKRRSEILASCGIEHSIVVTGTREIQPKKKHSYRR
jgi:predicted house-cleaning NTP pyrophosphatase (Maf/HAM1 superfamily)